MSAVTLSLKNRSISNHKPRKGTETSVINRCYLVGCDRFQTTNPARGRKQVVYIPKLFAVKFQTTNPARGRKRTNDESAVEIPDVQFQTTNPARGRKREDIALFHSADADNFKPQTPQGDGNSRVLTSSPETLIAFQTTNPARGRKLGLESNQRCFLCHISNHKPRKGTETRRTRTAFHRP